MNFIRLLRDGKGPSEFFVNDLQANYLGNIKELNIIVGANNTRKSRFVRSLINLEFKVLINSPIDLNILMNQASSLFEDCDEELKFANLIQFTFNQTEQNPPIVQEIQGYFDRQISMKQELTLFDVEKMVNEIKNQISAVAVPDGINQLKGQIAQAHSIISTTKDIILNLKIPTYSFDNPNSSAIPGLLYRFIDFQFPDEPLRQRDRKLDILIQVTNWLTALGQIDIQPYFEAQLIYIPVLRASRKLESGGKDIFKETIKKQYNLTDNHKLSIETGLDLYEKIEAARNGHRQQRDDFSAFEKFLSQVFFQSRAIDIIAVKSSSATKQHVMISIEGDNHDIAIHDLGDGIQAVIILLLPIFTASKGAWIFVDEPENNLHPGYQNILMRAICEHPKIKEKELRFFINTHSNHILSESLLGNADTEILVFSRRDKDSTNIAPVDGTAQHILEALGVFNTSVLIANCSIWVEGITDRLYLRAFLKAYIEAHPALGEPLEGFQYSFIEYAGNNLSHYTFNHGHRPGIDHLDDQIHAFFINSNVFLIADTDFNKDDKHTFYETLAREKTNFHYHQTQLPEVENLLPLSVLESWLIQDIKADPEEVASVLQKLPEKQKLGLALHEKLTLSKNKKRKFMNTAQGGTLKPEYKNRLASFLHKGVAEKKITWDELKQAQPLSTLVEAVYAFIIQNNPR